MENNHKIFLKAYGTDLIQDGTEIKEDLGFLANTRSAKLILQGKYKTPLSVNSSTYQLLKQIGDVAIAHKKQTINPIITKEDFQYYWKGSREKTSSSISGLHFGH